MRLKQEVVSLCIVNAFVLGVALAPAPAVAQSHAKGWNPM
jgi:hypothetical protein